MEHDNLLDRNKQKNTNLNQQVSSTESTATNPRFENNKTSTASQMKLIDLMNNSPKIQQQQHIQTLADQFIQRKQTDSQLTVQLQLPEGAYQVKRKTANLRSDDPEYSVQEILNNGDEVQVIDSGGKTTKFAAGRITNEHSWVKVMKSKNIGWVTDSKLKKANNLLEFALVNPFIDQFGYEPTSAPVAQWTHKDKTFRIYLNGSTMDCYTEGEVVGHISNIVAAEGVLSFGGIHADEQYPGLGSALLSTLLSRHSDQFTVRVKSIVGAHGYWKKLGLEIPEEFIFSTEQIEPLMRTGLSKRKAIEELTVKVHVSGVAVGDQEVDYNVFAQKVGEEVQSKKWNPIG